jgi:DNA repair protein RecO (recombination protein O)
MPEPRSYQIEAIVIKKTRLGEADRILTMYTPDRGKVQAVARGVRKPGSKMAGHLELLTCSKVWLARGRNLPTITASQTINGFMPLKSDLVLGSLALYATELVNQFTADQDKNLPLFDLLLGTLEQLCQTGNRELVLRYFELRLLEYVGYRPELIKCVSCQRDLVPAVNTFSPGTGGMLCPACSSSQPFGYPLSVNAQKVMRLMQTSDYATMLRLRVNAELNLELKQALAGYIRYLLEHEVKSAGWLDSLGNTVAGTEQALPRQPS